MFIFFLLKNQFVIAGFFILLHTEGYSRQLGDDQLAGGIDDAARTQMTADGTQILFGQGNVQMAALFVDDAVEADDLAVVADLPDGDPAGIPDPPPGNAAHRRQNDSCSNFLFPAQLPDGKQQVIPPVQANAVNLHFSAG